MDLLPLNDMRWKSYRTGYNRQLLDTPQWLQRLLENKFPESHWDYLWDELHHQGDVGEASYAVVPYLSQYAEQTGSTEWHIWGFPVVVELARLDGNNPEIPREIEASYQNSLKELAHIAVKLESWPEEASPVMSACIALAKDQPIFARAYLEMAALSTALAFLKDETGWEPRA